MKEQKTFWNRELWDVPYYVYGHVLLINVLIATSLIAGLAWLNPSMRTLLPSGSFADILFRIGTLISVSAGIGCTWISINIKYNSKIFYTGVVLIFLPILTVLALRAAGAGATNKPLQKIYMEEQ